MENESLAFEFAEIALSALPKTAVVTCSARFEDFDGYYSGRQFNRTVSFKKRPLGEVLRELDRTAKSQLGFKVRVVSLTIEKIALPSSGG